MSNKSWEELLFLYLTGTLSEEDRIAFERYLAESESRRAELNEWRELGDAVRSEAEARADKLPALTPAFYQRLQAGFQPSLNGSHSKQKSELERKTMIIARPAPYDRSSSRLPRQWFTIAAAFVAVLMIGGVLLFSNGPGNPENNASPSGLNAQQESATPVPSPTFTMTPTPQATATLVPSNVFTGTPIPVDATMLPPTVLPPEQFLASVTPSQIEPIVSSPARVSEETRLPTGDASRGVAWSPDGERLAVAGFRGVWLYEGNLNKAPRLLAEADAGVLEVAFGPDNSLLATLSAGQTLRIWNVEAGQEMATMSNTPLWDELQFSPDGQYLLSKNSDQRVSLARLREGVLESEPLTSANLSGYYSLLNPIGDLLTGYNNDGDVVQLDYETGEEATRFQYSVGFVRDAAYSLDGALLALGGDEEVNVVSKEGGYRNSMTTLGMVSDLSFNGNNSMLAAAMRSEKIQSVWLMNMDPANTFYTAIFVYDLPVAGVDFNPKANLLAVTTDDGRVFILAIGLE